MTLENLKFSKSHEWVRVEGESAVVGLTDYAQHELGDVVYLELPAQGKSYKMDDPCGNVESPKAVDNIYSPVSGTVFEVNKNLGENPGLVNQDPYGEGWLIKIKLENRAELDQLMTNSQYEEYLKGIRGE